MKTNELTGAALDWAVAKCEGRNFGVVDGGLDDDCPDYSTQWAQGGPIIGREGITLRCGLYGWDAELPEFGLLFGGSTALEAAMRCYVASKLGNEVELPEAHHGQLN